MDSFSVRTSFTSILFLSVSFAFGFAHAASEVQDATKKTQDLLSSPADRQKVIETSPAAKRADERVGAAAGGNLQYQQEIYELSATILPVLLEMAKNDPAQAQALLLEAQKDPKRFFDRLPAAQKKRIQDLSQRISSDQKEKTNP